MSNIYSTLKKNRLLVIFCSIVLLLAVFAANSRFKAPSPGGDSAKAETAVSLIAIKDYVREKTITLDSGTVESVSQADLRSQFSAPAASVSVSLGDAVSAGQILVSMKNNDVLAQLDQAKAGLAAAQASLASAKIGARPEDIRLYETQLSQAKMALIASIKDAYAKSDDSVRNHVNKFFVNPSGKSPEFMITLDAGASSIQFGAVGSDASRKIGIQKVELEKKLNGWQEQINTLDLSSDPKAFLSAAKSNLDFMTGFMNDLSSLVNSLTTDSVAYKPVLDGYKSELSAARAAVSGAQMSLLGSETNWKIAGESLELKTAGATLEQLQQQEALAAQASASVAGLEAQVEKTYIRSPISGRISFLDARVGELISPGQLVASVVNPSALQVKTYASENDFLNIAINDLVSVNGQASGKVYKISPAIDPATKKAEIIVIVTKNSPGLPIVVGQTVNLSIESQKSTAAPPVYLLPIQAVKTNGASDVFAVGSDGLVFALRVAIGDMVGEKIEVSGSLDPGQIIISSIIGLAPGDKVTINEQ